jgi:thiol-disulfide isomerase/thioredoxin
MKSHNIFFLILLLIFPTSAFSQSASEEPNITIRVLNGKYLVSGIVDGQVTRDLLVSQLQTELPVGSLKIDVKTDYGVGPFAVGWQEEFQKSLMKVREWKSGLYVFSRNKAKDRKAFEAFLRSSNFQPLNKVEQEKLIDPTKKTTLVFLFATWCGPCRVQIPRLNDFFSEYSQQGLDIVALDTDDESKKDIDEFIRQNKMIYRVGLASLALQNSFVNATRFPGIPQILVIVEGKIVHITAGAAPNEAEKLKSIVRQIVMASK